MEINRFRKKMIQQKDTTFYVICRKGDEEEITNRIKEVVSGSMSLKERTRIDSLYDQESLNDIHGWFEIDNGYYFFADKEMFEGMFFLYTGRKP
jgi:hypothetical protein